MATVNRYPIGYRTHGAGIPLVMTEEGWRAETKAYHHRRGEWDYCKPWIYMITLTCQPQEAEVVRGFVRLAGGGDFSGASDFSAMPLLRSSRCSGAERKQRRGQGEQEGQAQGEREGQAQGEQKSQAQGERARRVQRLAEIYSRKGRPHLFGELARDRKDGRAYIELNGFGREAERLIYNIEQYHKEVKILEQVVMTNHVHFVVQVRERLPEKKPLGKIINAYKMSVNRAFKEYWLGMDGHDALPEGLLAGSAYEPATREANYTRGKTGLVFERDFHERILFHKGQIETMLAYCRDNPERLAALKEHPDRFERVTDWQMPLPFLPNGGTKGSHRADTARLGNLLGVKIGGGGGSAGTSDFSAMAFLRSSRCSGAERKQRRGQGEREGQAQGELMLVTVNSIGNQSLLMEPEHIQIQCSRSMKPTEIADLQMAVLALCRRGVVPVSPCISAGEKQIARAVMEAGYRLIVIFPDGIPADMPQYKPYGQYFEACRKGLLLIISPWRYPAREMTAVITREECLFMNDLAAQIAG